tara:strand:- start:1287 stop:2330 length:1044 start_codon:yes stop_codon:yes gene_type:complete
MKKALVTGGSGYFGTLLCEKLVQDGWHVKNLDLIAPINKLENIDFHQTDVRDLSKARKIFEDVDSVFHNVALVPITKSSNYGETNILGTQNTIEMAIKTGVKSFIHTSSSAVFGIPKKNPVRIHDIPFPAEKYGQSKLNSEFLLATYSSKIDISIIRPRTILGHGRLGIFQILFDWISKGWNIPLLGNGENIYQFIHADDLASACILSSNSRGLNYYNIGAKRFCSMRETLEALCDYAGTGSKVISLPQNIFEYLMNTASFLKLSPLGSYHSLMYGRSLYFDISKAEKELGWNSVYSNKESIIDSYKYYISNKDKINSGDNENIKSPHSLPMKQGALKILGYLLNII